MNDSQIIHTQQVVTDFLREQLAADAIVDAKQATNFIEHIDSTLDSIKAVPTEKQIDAWVNLFQLLMQTRVSFYEQIPLDTSSTFCDALTVVHTFLWNTLQKSTLNLALTKASEEKLKYYAIVILPAFLQPHNQSVFEERRIKTAALNNECILNNDYSMDEKRLLIEKVYPCALYQRSDNIQASILILENKWDALSSTAISQEKLMHAQVIFIRFLTNQKDMENRYIDPVNRHLGRLIAHQTSAEWTMLLSFLMESYIYLCSKKDSNASGFFRSKAMFGDALRAVHICLLQMINTAMPGSSCAILHSLAATKLRANEALYELRDRRSSSIEAIKKAELLSAALGDNNELRAMSESDNKRIDIWVDELQNSLKPPVLIAPKKSEATAPITSVSETLLTSVSETLHPNVTMRKKEKPKRITYNPQHDTSF